MITTSEEQMHYTRDTQDAFASNLTRMTKADASTVIYWTMLHNPKFITSADAHRVHAMLYGDTEPYGGAFIEHQFRNDIAEKLRLEIDEHGWIKSDTSQRIKLEAIMYKDDCIIDSAYPFSIARHNTTGALVLLNTHNLRYNFEHKNEFFKGMFIRMKGIYEGISIVQVDPGKSSQLYTDDQSDEHQQSIRTIMTLFNNGTIRKTDKLFVITDENYTPLDIIDVQKELTKLGMEAGKPI